MRKRTKKTDNILFKHAKKRALERYQLELSETLWRQLAGKIQNQIATFLWKESNSRVHYLVDDQFVVVYDKTRHAITTFLPPESIHGYLEQGSPDRLLFDDPLNP